MPDTSFAKVVQSPEFQAKQGEVLAILETMTEEQRMVVALVCLGRGLRMIRTVSDRGNGQ